MTSAASTVPVGTSRREVSTRRAKNGAVAMVSETVAAIGPIEVLTSHWVNGMSATIQIAYGIERVIFTTTEERKPYSTRIGARPPGRVRCRTMLLTPPMSTVAIPEMPTITTLSHIA